MGRYWSRGIKLQLCKINKFWGSTGEKGEQKINNIPEEHLYTKYL